MKLLITHLARVINRRERNIRVDMTGWEWGFTGNCDSLKFDNTDKWCIHKSGFLLENNTYKILTLSDKNGPHIATRSPNLVFINKKIENLLSCGFLSSNRSWLKYKNLNRVSQDNEKKKRLCETKLFIKNLIKGINYWVVSLVRSRGPFLKWTREEIQ